MLAVQLLFALVVGTYAQSSHHLFPSGTLTESELETISSLPRLIWESPKPALVSNRSRQFGVTKDKLGSKGHKVTNLHRELTHPCKHPELVERLLQLAREADATAGFGIVERLRKAGGDLNIRAAESLRYEETNSDEATAENPDRDGLGWHNDFGSLITMSIALSHKKDYTGEVMVWQSFREHRVKQVTGNRHVVVLELWDSELCHREDCDRMPHGGRPDHPEPIIYCIRTKIFDHGIQLEGCKGLPGLFGRKKYQQRYEAELGKMSAVATSSLGDGNLATNPTKDSKTEL